MPDRPIQGSERLRVLADQAGGDIRDLAQMVLGARAELHEAHQMLGLYLLYAPTEVHERVREKRNEYRAKDAAARARNGAAEGRDG